MKIENGKKYLFTTTDTELMKYNGTEVEIIRPLTKEEADIDDVGNMYKGKFEDGYERDIFEDELSRQNPHLMVERRIDMKIETIKYIEAVLKQDVNASALMYKDYKKEKEEKYGTEWIRQVMSKDEIKVLDGRKEDYNRALERYEDFMAHDWK